MSVYILPGMGANSGMYGAHFQALENVCYLDWPAFQNERSIYELAKRIVEENGIVDGDIVGGSSLGGMVSAEIAKHVRLERILLIGSTLSADKVNQVFKTLSSYIGFAPIQLIQLFTGKVSSVMDARLFEMFTQTHPMFLRNMAKAVFEWDGNHAPNCAVSAIHGGRDLVIKPPDFPTTIIDKAGHLIALSHEPQVVDFVRASLSPG